ncbi:MAG TPA: hypothetical protein VGW40_08680 [Allosphingosinicella sp.]|nr:hypothetical protein [Allosphingosinicella sp.]
MTLPDQVSSFIARRAPEPVCDACVADYLALSRRQVTAARHRARDREEFRRFAGRCAGCCTHCRVTVAVAV